MFTKISAAVQGTFGGRRRDDEADVHVPNEREEEFWRLVHGGPPQDGPPRHADASLASGALDA
ncbi:hypothetical protein ACFVTX_10640 [Agromyces sp. NPDC058136]|uniref:hypothetical protein n=1 Tax=Agromyces sp. NPDC058136 TaxID=3346354 RepID=UPI0036D93C20